MHFDWSTLILQTVNVLVLLWLLRRFLFRPVIAIIAARREAADKMLADAARVREQAQAQAEQTAQHEKALAADSDRVLADTRATAETERIAILERSKSEAAELRDVAQAGLDRERGQMRHELQVQARHLAVTIASRLLGRIPAQAVNAALLESLRSLPGDEWRRLAGPGEALEVVTAVPLDPGAQAACTEMVRQRLGCPVQFGTDPSLIAGVELRGPHARLQNNWRADLDRIAEELSQDGKHLIVA
jgi:F-type H+-transporting ATPase subunit b